MGRLIRLLLFLALASSGASCVMQPVAATGEEQQIEIYPGDVLRVLTKEGERPTFELTDADEHGLIGEDHHIPYDDIVFIEKRKISRLATAGGMVAGTMMVRLIHEALYLQSEGLIRILVFQKL